MIGSIENMAGKCCKAESSGCAVASSESECWSKKECGSRFLGLPKCVWMTAAAVALVGISASATINYLKRK